MTIGDIKNLLEGTEIEGLPAVLASLEGDERSGVKKLVKHYKKWYTKAKDEEKRLDGMLVFERRYADYGNICGTDEVGAGPLAGPVAAGAVILPPDCIIDGMNDSKQLSAKKRDELYVVIKEKAVACAVAFVDNNCIDEINILQARLKAMALACESLVPRPGLMLVDGNAAPNMNIKHVLLGKDGDCKSMSVAAASVLAKVERDRLMLDYHKIYPQYGFDRNKGYGTAEHLAAIKNHGPTPIHRMTFITGLR